MKSGGRPVYNAVKSALLSYCRIPSARRLKRRRRLQQQCLDAATAVSVDVDRKQDIDTEFCTPSLQHQSISSESLTSSPHSPSMHQPPLDDPFRSASAQQWYIHEYYNMKASISPQYQSFNFYHSAPPLLPPTTALYSFPPAPGVPYSVHQQYPYSQSGGHQPVLSHHHSVPQWSQQHSSHYHVPYSQTASSFTSQPSAPYGHPPPSALPPPHVTSSSHPWANSQPHIGPSQTTTSNTNHPWWINQASYNTPDPTFSNSQRINSDLSNYNSNDVLASSNAVDNGASPSFPSHFNSNHNSSMANGPSIPSGPPGQPHSMYAYPYSTTNYGGNYGYHNGTPYGTTISEEDRHMVGIDGDDIEGNNVMDIGVDDNNTEERNNDVESGYNHDFSPQSSTVNNDVDNLYNDFSMYPHSHHTHHHFEQLPSFEPTEDMRNETCAICLGALGEGRVSASARCRHVMHTSCLSMWLRRDSRRACPVCRIPYSRRAETIPTGAATNSSAPSDNVSLDDIDVNIDRLVHDNEEETVAMNNTENNDIHSTTSAESFVNNFPDNLSNDIVDSSVNDEQEVIEDIG